MRIRFATLAAGALLGCAMAVGCVEAPHHDANNAAPTAGVSCIDKDHDGWGDGCANGHDCDDTNALVHDGCLHCAEPTQGCACAVGARPQSCSAPKTKASDGTTMCNEGTRYCRSGVWSGCEDVFSYPKPAASAQSVIDTTGGPVHCSDCAIDCFLLHDNLDPVDGGLGDAGAGTVLGDGGGLSLISTMPIMPDAYVFDPSTCMINTAPDRDCDGIPDQYDPYPDQKPFATANPTLFLDVAPGETGTGSIDVKFFLNSADVYMLVDQSGSMGEEADALKAGLKTGTFITDPTYNCADYDFDLKPNNELKTQGLIGAIRCLMRDSNFGVGLFREIPFNAYAPEDQIVFRNYTDVWSTSYLNPQGVYDPSLNLAAAVNGINQFTTIGNNDWPEADMLALNSVVTGNGMYFGTTRPNIPPRTTCPNGTWGYPCFRNGAIPIVIMFTDAMLHNGPSSNNYAYSSSSLGMTVGTSTTLNQEDNKNETFGSTEILGDLTNSYITLQGDTTAMSSDLNASAVTCVSSTSAASPDALFQFTISGAVNKTVKLSTEGSEFDTTVSLFRGALAASTTVATGLATNDATASAYSLGNNYNKFQRVTGSTSTLAADYSANDVTCGTSQQGKDSVFTFTLSQPTTVALDTANSSFGTVVGLFSGTPKVPSSYTTISNTNDKFTSAYGVGSLYTNYLGFNGDTSSGSIAADFTGSVVGCGAGDTSPDEVYQFTLSQAARVRVSAEDSVTFKPVLALTTAGSLLPTVTAITNTNDTAATAYNIGDMSGKVLQLTGDNTALAADYAGVTTGCNAADSGKDAVFKFTLPSSKTLEINTDGSAFDTVLSLYSGGVSSDATPVLISSNSNETGATALNLGTVDNTKYVVSGGNTTAMTADYNGTQISCNSSTFATDAAFKFHVNSTRIVRIDSSGTPWDTVVSLHQPALPDATVTPLFTNNNETTASAYVVANAVDSTNQSFTGSTTSMTADHPVNDGATCVASSSAPDAVYKFTITNPGTYEINTQGSSFDTVLGLFPSNPSFAAPTGPTSEGVYGETKLTGTRPSATITMGDGRTDGSNVDMTSASGGWVVASATITSSSLHPSPQGINLGSSAITPSGGAGENATTAQALGAVEQKDVTVTDTFSGSVNDHSVAAAWTTCSDATAKTGAGLDRVYSFTPTQDGTVRATMKASNASATSYTLGVFSGTPALTSVDWGDSSNFSPPTVASWPTVTLDSTTCPSTTDIVINTAGTTAATVFPNWCSGVTKPAFETQTQTAFGSTASQIMVITFSGLTLASTQKLRIVGDKPAVLAVFGDATINGTIDASYYNSTYANGAGSTVACTATTGGLGAAGTNDGSGGAGGGSGGGFASPGGVGGKGASGGTAGGAVSSTEGNALLHPLRAGCAGGKGGNGTGSGGAGGSGGGGVQLTVTGALSGSGTVQANGSGGGSTASNKDGGGGGGSGGAVLVEYGTNTSTLHVYANGGGGGGGAGSSAGTAGAVGTSSTSVGATGGAGGGSAGNGGAGGYTSSGSGLAGSQASRGGGGGGGGIGYTRMRALNASTWTPSNLTGVTYSGTTDVVVPGTCTLTITTAVTTSTTTPPVPVPTGTGCPTLPTAQFIHPSTAAAGDYVVVFPISGSFWVKSGASIVLRGSVANSAPVVFAVQGSVQIDGTIDASSSKNSTYGAGANPLSCSTSGNGGNGAAGTAADHIGDPGGGGGGSKDSGLAGGTGSASATAAGTAGAAWNSTTTPLKGGCAGGSAKNPGGYGGGAVQIAAKGTLYVSKTGVIDAGGGGGKVGSASEDGGGGGGAGGAIRLEARSFGVIDTSNGAVVTANGGAGASACSPTTCSGGSDGADGASTTAAVGGSAISYGSGGGGNGGLSAIDAAGTVGTAGTSGLAQSPPSTNVNAAQWSYASSPTWTCTGTQTTLATAIASTSSTTAITVASTTGFPSTGGDIVIDNETITYTGTTSTTFTGITRGARGSTGATHAVSAVIFISTNVNASQTTLSTGINSSSTSALTVGSTLGFPASGSILIDSEVISYTSTTATTFAGTITRHAASTSAASHSAGAVITISGIGTSLSAGATTVTVFPGGTTGFSTAGAIMIDSEIMTYTGTTSTTFTGVTRGAHNTAAATHANNAAISPVTVIDSSLACTSAITGDTCGATATTSATACTNSVAQSNANGPTVMVLRMKGLTLTNRRVLKLKGDKPIIFLVMGNVSVDTSATVDAGAFGSTAGPGGSYSGQCDGTVGRGQTGGTGGYSSNRSSGGGGGGFGTSGGTGAGGATDGSAGAATTSVLNNSLQPLRGGCSGGPGGSAAGAGTGGVGGAGGGAFEISASGTITVGTGTYVANLSAGGGGSSAPSTGGTQNNNNYWVNASGGGGSGGGILLVSPNATPVSFGTNGVVRVHGGASGGTYVDNGASTAPTAGQDAHVTNDTAASAGAVGGDTTFSSAGTTGGKYSATTTQVSSLAGPSGVDGPSYFGTIYIGSGGGGGGGVVATLQQSAVLASGGGGGGGGGAGGIVVTSGLNPGSGSGGTTGTYDFTSAAAYCTRPSSTTAGTQLEWDVTAGTTYYIIAKQTAAADAAAFKLDLQWADKDWPGYTEDRYSNDVYQQFYFSGSGTRPFTIDTQNTGFNAVLALYSDDTGDNVTSNDTAIGFAYANVSGYASISATLTAGVKYYAIVKPLIGASLASPTVNLSIQDTQAASGAIDIGTIDNAWTTYTGDTSTMADNSDFSGCGANVGANDAFYKFHVSSPNKSLTIDMTGTATDLVLGVYQWDDTYIGCDINTGSGDTLSYTHTYTTAGDYYVVIKGHTATTKGAYSIGFKDNGWVSNMLQCDDNSGGSSTSLITRALTAGTYYAVVKGKAATDKGNYKIDVKDTTWTNAANRLTCNDDDLGVTTSKIQQNLTPGDYWAVVKGHNMFDAGAYTLTVQDITSPPTNSQLSCNDDHALVNTSRINTTLAAGTYYVTVKGKTATSTGFYKLNISDTSVAVASVLQCDASTGVNSTALIERDLDPGTYNVVVKGKSVTDKGAYKLLLRDLTTLPTGLVSCDHTSGSAGKSYLEQDLPAGTFSVVVKGDAAASAGNYELTVRDANNIAVSTTAVGCDDNTGYGNTSILTKSIAPGTYFAAVKGHSTTDKGRYQLSIGAGATTAGTYVPPTWSQTLAALQAKNVHVMSVLSCYDDALHGNLQGDCNSTRTQATALANQTNALGYNLQPLVFDIKSDGTGLSKTVVDGVASLAKYLQMDVGLVVSFDPDANPGFVVDVTPVDAAGDGCTGISASQHLACVPGATPHFNVSFTNPLAHPVPLNPADPNGGYNFRALLIGDNKFLVDQVPIYIVPKNITHIPMPPTIQAMGTYFQDLPAAGCSGNLRPDWHDLTWTADIPNGTKVDFKACTVDSTTDFPACTYATICTVQGGPTCTKDSDCNTALGSFCADSGSCQTITNGTCTTDMDCPISAKCISTACTFNTLPVLINQALPVGSNYKAYLRMQLDLYANTTNNTGPVVHDWTLAYYCRNQL